MFEPTGVSSVAPVHVPQRRGPKPGTKRVTNPGPAVVAPPAAPALPTPPAISAPAPAPAKSGALVLIAEYSKDTGNYYLFSHINKGKVISQTHLAHGMFKDSIPARMEITIRELPD